MSLPRRMRHWLLSLTLLLLVVLTCATGTASAANWVSDGNGASNDRYQPAEHTINPFNVARLKPKWVFTTHGDESATPAVVGGVVYFPDWGGYINAVNASTGQLIWQETVQSLEPAGTVAGAFSRDTPVVDGDELIFGDNFPSSIIHPGGDHLFAVSTTDGHLLWTQTINSNQAAVITGSPVIAGDEVIIGSSADEVNFATDPMYPCCTFRGNMMALDPVTGDVLWNTYTVPDNGGVPCASDSPPAGCGYSGASVWGQPAVDAADGLVFVGTGNNYTAPDSAVACEKAAEASGGSDADCTSPDDHFDSVLALKLATGAVVWSHKAEGWDAYTLACLSKGAGIDWCPDPEGPDWDFGAGPNLVSVTKPGGGSEFAVGDGQKSGLYWMFDALTGTELWSTSVGPGTKLGGMAWGTATDGNRIYVHETGATHRLYRLPTNQQWVIGGSWAALDPSTGAIDWDVATPSIASAYGPQAVANGVVYTGSTASLPGADNMFALSARTGRILWRFPSGGSVGGGAAIANGTVYWGSGYSEYSSLGWTGNNKLYAFTLNGQ